MTLKQAYAYRDAVHTQRKVVDDQIAVRSSAVYDAWEYLVDIGYTAEKAGFRFRYGEQMYKTRQDGHTFSAEWKPSIDTAALYEAIDMGHMGTLDDPIPFVVGMELVNGKYYQEYGVTYLCTRDSGAPIYHNLVNLVGIYVEMV